MAGRSSQSGENADGIQRGLRGENEQPDPENSDEAGEGVQGT